MKYYAIILLMLLSGCIDYQSEQVIELYGLPAKRYDTPGKRLNWWRSLNWRWQTVFSQMSRNRFSSIRNLTDKELKKLFVTEKMTINNYLNVDIKLESLSGLAELTNLKELSILDQSININESITLTHLQYLYVGQNNIDLEAWGKKMPNVNNLWFDCKNLTTLQGINYFTKLENLTFHKNNVTSLVTINKLDRLKNLDAFHNQLENLQGLEKSPSLEILNVAQNRLNDISGIETIPNLKELDISGNPNIQDLSPILSCKKLQTLKVSGLSVVSIAQLKKVIPYLRVINTKLDTVSKGY